MPKRRSPAARPDQRGEVLVAILNSQADFAILRDQLWYRVPVASAPKRWPPRWLAWYQTNKYAARITRMIDRLGGLNEGLVPRRFYYLPGGPAQQLSLFGSEPDPDLESGLEPEG